MKSLYSKGVLGVIQGLCWDIEGLGFPKIRGTHSGCPPAIRILVYWSPYWGPLILGNYQIPRTKEATSFARLLREPSSRLRSLGFRDGTSVMSAESPRSISLVLAVHGAQMEKGRQQFYSGIVPLVCRLAS